MKLSHYINTNTTAIKLCVRQWAEEDRPCTRPLSLRRIRLNGSIITIIPIVLLLELYLLETVCGLSGSLLGHQI